MNGMIAPLVELYNRDLDRLVNEIESYEIESDLWLLNGDIKNTAGNLCLHLCGNLQHFFGHVIDGSAYVRKRDDEFNLKNVPKSDLISLIGDTRKSVIQALENFDEQLWDNDFPIEVFGKPMTYGFFIIHLSGHLNYHLGQINYHRRLLTM